MFAQIILTLFLILVLYYSWRILSSKIKKTVDKGELSKNELLPLPGISIFHPKLLVVLYKRSLQKLALFAAKCGPIYEIRFPKSNFVFINDWKLGKEIFKNPAFCGRPSNEYWKFAFGNSGFGSVSGRVWKEQRKFCFQYLKTIGFGTKFMESLVQDDIHDFVENWRRKDGKEFSPKDEFFLPTFTSFWVLLAGDKNLDGELLEWIFNFYTGFGGFVDCAEMILCSSNVKLETITRIAKWIPLFPGIKAFENGIFGLRKYLLELVDSRRKLHDLNKPPTNLIDHYLSTIVQTVEHDSTFFGETGLRNVAASLIDLILAGGDPAVMLEWAMLHLVRNPDVQEKIQAEIDAVVGSDKCPCLQDMDHCPYTTAFICELLRFNPAGPLGFPHEATEDSNIGPYFIKKGTWLLLGIENINFDPLVWGDPENFRPERFLSADGKSVVKNEALSSFSYGLRRCVGEQLARNNIFLFVSAICQKFILLPDSKLNVIPGINSTQSHSAAPKLETFLMRALERSKVNGNGKFKVS